jgi:hypothetical protein
VYADIVESQCSVDNEKRGFTVPMLTEDLQHGQVIGLLMGTNLSAVA